MINSDDFVFYSPAGSYHTSFFSFEQTVFSKIADLFCSLCAFLHACICIESRSMHALSSQQRKEKKHPVEKAVLRKPESSGNTWPDAVLFRKQRPAANSSSQSVLNKFPQNGKRSVSLRAVHPGCGTALQRLPHPSDLGSSQRLLPEFFGLIRPPHLFMAFSAA